MRCILLIALLLAVVHARTFRPIDPFTRSQFLVATADQGTSAGAEDPNPNWYSPYYYDDPLGGRPAGASFANNVSILGGQRDMVLGYYSNSNPVTTSILVNTVARPPDLPAPSATVAFPLDWIGGAYIQYDGIDAVASSGVFPTFPGALLNRLPGIGVSGTGNTPATPGFDFTFGNRVTGISLQLTSDQLVNYFLDVLDSGSAENHFNFTLDPASETDLLLRYIRFDSFGWSNPSFDWTDVAAFQIRIWTYNPGQPFIRDQANGPDTSIFFLNLVGYEVSGYIRLDCGCDGSIESFQADQSVILFDRSTTPRTEIARTTTNAAGFYQFDGSSAAGNLGNGIYTVCLENTARTFCTGSTACRDFTFANLTDVTGLNFTLTVNTVLTPPPSVNLTCGSCTNATAACTGFATVTGCDAIQTPVTTFTDSVDNSNECVRVITRTFRDPNSLQTAIQIIRLTDSSAPVLVTPATSVRQNCSTASTFQTFLTTQAGAVATDCTRVIWTNNNTGAPSCAATTVTFTARDPCGNPSITTTANYEVFDDRAPVFTQQPTAGSAQCNLKSPTNAYASFVNSFGGALASDNCGAATLATNVSASSPPANGCNQAVPIEITATDSCGNIARTTTTFTIIDTTDPVFLTAPANRTVECTDATTNNNNFQNYLNTAGGASVSDNCIANDANLVIVNNYAAGAFGQNGPCNQTATVVFSVTDPCGRTASRTGVYFLRDSNPPVLTSPATSVDSNCDGSGSIQSYAQWIAANGNAVATDSCSQVSWTNTGNTGAPATCGQQTTVTFIASDNCGQSVRTTASYRVVDTVQPSFVQPPANQAIQCTSDANTQFQAWLSSAGGATVTDNCSPNAVVINNDFTGSGPATGRCNATTSVRFTPRDACGLLGTARTATFTISDNIAPVWSPGASDRSISCNTATNQANYTQFLNTFGGGVATDTCNTVTVSNNAPATLGSFNCTLSRTVIFTANDGCGNVATTTAVFSVADDAAPVLSRAASDRTVECNGAGNTADVNSFLSSNGGALASDTCGAVTWRNDFTGLSNDCNRTALVTFTACDTCNLCVSTTARITVVDTGAPVISPQAQSAVVECDPNGNQNAFDAYIANNGGARATDVCSNTTLTWTSSFEEAPRGCDSERVTFTVTDACGRSATTTSTFTIVDRVAPTFNPAPQNVAVECDGTGNTAAYRTFVDTNSGAAVTDACATNLVISNNAPATGPVGCGTQSVIFTAQDCTNTATRTATFTVRDTTPPVFTTPAQNQTVGCDTTNNLQQVQAWLSANANAVVVDSCYGSNVQITNNFQNLVANTCGSSATVTFRAVDPCGQFSTSTATFTVRDDTPPTITNPASAATFECDPIRNNGDIQSYLNNNGGARATDSCSSVTWRNSFTTAPNECTGPQPVTFTAVDRCGNEASTAGSIEITDLVNPTFANFPGDRLIRCNESPEPANTGRPDASDACAGTLTPTYTDVTRQEPDERLCPGDTIITRTWTVTDDCGNIATRDQVITITLPVGECIPTACPPCDDVQCCESSLAPVPCNPVGCNAVPCIPTTCESVPCLPIVCGNTPSVPVPVPVPGAPNPIPVPVPVPVPIGPVPVASPAPCEPVYIYVFDDDEDPATFSQPVNPGPETQSSASVLSISFVILALLALLI